MKTARQLSLLVLLLPVITGCGSPLPPEAEGRSVVHVWSGWTGDSEEAFERTVQVFNQSQSEFWVVNASTIEDDSRIMRALTAGTPPDVFFFWEPSLLGVVAGLGCVEPLEERFDASGLQGDEFVDGALELCTVNDQLVALPLLLDVFALFYDKQLFREAGLDPGNPPKSTQELLECIQILTRLEDGKLRRMGYFIDYPDVALALLGAEFYGPDARPQFDDPSCVRALELLVRIHELQGGGQEIDAFRAGFGEYTSPSHQFFVHKIAMYSVGQWWPELTERYAPDMDYAVAPFPCDSDPNGISSMGGNFMCLARGAKNPEGGWAFMRWAQTVEAQLAFAKPMNSMPNIRKALEAPELRSGGKLWVKFGEVADVALTSKMTFIRPTSISAQYLNEMKTATQFAVRGTKPPGEACKDAQVRLLKAWEEMRSL
jgi:multiple sugar transport system substrate-binding protein